MLPRRLRRHVWCVAVLILTSGAVVDRSITRHEFRHESMGTVFRIVLHGPDDDAARLAADAAFERVDALDAALSDYRADSDLRRLEDVADGEPVPVGDDLWNVLSEAQFLAAETGGAFDVTVGSLTRLWRWAARRATEPSAGRIASARATVGFAGLRLDERTRTVSMTRAGIRLDLGGIAKGYAVDRAFDIVRARGFGVALVDGGGDLRLGDPPPGEPGWRVSVPTANGGGWETLIGSRVAMATSGATYRSLETGERSRSHVIDPRSGFGVSVDRIVTVWAATASRADGLASALSVLGRAGSGKALELGAERVRMIDELGETTYGDTMEKEAEDGS